MVIRTPRQIKKETFKIQNGSNHKYFQVDHLTGQITNLNKEN